MNQKYKITFSGTILAGFDPEKTKEDIQKLLQLNATQVESFFSGRLVVLKKNLPLDEAQKIKSALESKGLLVTLDNDDVAPILKNEPKEEVHKELTPDIDAYYAPPSTSTITTKNYGEGETPEFFKFSFQGRYGRLNYLNLYWSVYGAMLLFSMLGGFIIRMNEGAGLVIMGIGSIAFLFFYIRGMALRLHDLNKSGWYLLLFLLGIIPLLGALFVLGFSIYIMCARGTEGENNYGLPTKQGNIVGLILTILSILSLIGILIFFAVMGISIFGALPGFRY